MSNECIDIFITQIEYTAKKKPVKVWVSQSHGVMTVVRWIHTTMMISRRLFRHNPVSHGTNQPNRKLEFLQYMKVE